MNKITLTTEPSTGYALLDSGDEEKLERYGDVILSRPDPQALWPKRLEAGEWAKANASYTRHGEKGDWKLDKPELAEGWKIKFGDLEFLIKPTSFKHTGLFPEQLSNWEWVSEVVRKNLVKGRDEHDPNSPAETFPRVLNLFGYTGGASLAAAAAGASVTHVDASKTAVAWARENAKLSGLEEKPIRWIIEDALTFVERELKRGNKYDGIVMDPPAFGHGPKDELWKIEEDFIKIVKLCSELLSEKPLFFLINGYAAGYSPLAFAYNLEPIQKKYGGEIEYGDLTIQEEGSERLLPCGIFARWKNK